MDDELRRLFKNLLDMRAIAEDGKFDDKEKIEKVKDFIDISLQSKFFKKENFSNTGNIQQSKCALSQLQVGNIGQARKCKQWAL